MTARSVVMKVLECDHCQVTIKCEDARAAAVRRLAQENGWSLQPRRGSMHEAGYRPARDLCPDCAALAVAV